MLFGDLRHAYVREHRMSPKRPHNALHQRSIAAIIQGVLAAEAPKHYMAAALNPIVRMWHRGRGQWDCDYHSAGVLQASLDTKVEVEHGIEIAELIRHLVGNASAVHRATYQDHGVEASPEGADIFDEWSRAKRSGDLRRAAELEVTWSGVQWSGPPQTYSRSVDEVLDFMSGHYVRVLVTAEEHKRLGKAKAGRTKSTLGMPQPVGAVLSRYRQEGISVALMTPLCATKGDLVLPT